MSFTSNIVKFDTPVDMHVIPNFLKKGYGTTLRIPTYDIGVQNGFFSIEKQSSIFYLSLFDSHLEIGPCIFVNFTLPPPKIYRIVVKGVNFN